MPVSLQLLLSDYERARATGNTDRAESIFKQMAKIGLPDHLKSNSEKRRSSPKSRNQRSPQSKQTGTITDPGRF